MELKGPNRIIAKTGEVKELKHTDIESATIVWKGKKHYLLENKLSISLNKDDTKVYVYHMYSYLDDNGEKIWGRWYNFFDKFPLKDNKLVFKIDKFEDWGAEKLVTRPATVTVNFTEEATEKIKKLLEKQK